jgi:tyrosyl-tRNA synthetase
VSVPTDHHLLADLEWRGLVAHSTDPDALREALTAGSVRYYVGFDPTAPSLHMGNLVQIVTAMRLQRAGHTPYVLVGGATGMIGDPKESGERVLNSAETVKDWVERVRRQIEPFLSFEGENAATMVNNLDWTENLSTIDFLRDIGKHFPVNRMLARDVVRTRLEAGISYTEFSYVLLQSMDFLNLYREHGVTLQFGGSDQWGNLTGGVELIRRADGGHAHAFATPLITKADGTKYGKTEGGALWLDSEMMSPYAFYQFWLNQGDAEVGQLLRVFTFLSREEIEALEAEHAEKPFLRKAQRTLAEEVTSLVHGAEETRQIQAASEALFGGGELGGLSTATLAAALAEAGSVQVEGGAELPTIVDLLVVSGLSASKGEARRTVTEGGAYLNNERVSDPEARPTRDDLLGGWLVLRRGKKSFAGVEVV